MPYNQVETVDYIFDRYAFLGLTPTASLTDIKSALKRKRAENHPDRLHKAGPEVQQTARLQLEKLADCESMLLNPVKKAYFDERLAYFQQACPKAISPEGKEVVVLGRMSLNVPVLLGQDAGTPDELSQELLALTGADSQTTAKLRRLYQKDPEDADLRTMLVDALHKELMLAGIREEQAWQQVGINHKQNKTQGHLLDPLDYADEADRELTRTLDEDVLAGLSQVLGVARLGLAVPTLLLAAPGAADAPTHILLARLADVSVDDLLAQARTVMAVRRQGFTDIAAVKQALLAELADLIPVINLTPLPYRYGEFTLVLMDSEMQTALIIMGSHDDHRQLDDLPEHPCKGMSLTDLQQYPHPHDCIAFTFDPALGEPLLAVAPTIRRRRQLLGLI